MLNPPSHLSDPPVLRGYLLIQSEWPKHRDRQARRWGGSLPRRDKAWPAPGGLRVQAAAAEHLVHSCAQGVTGEAVLQMTNKRGGPFGPEEEVRLEMLSQQIDLT